jgi:hypothetical protein
MKLLLIYLAFIICSDQLIAKNIDSLEINAKLDKILIDINNDSLYINYLQSSFGKCIGIAIYDSTWVFPISISDYVNLYYKDKKISNHDAWKYYDKFTDKRQSGKIETDYLPIRNDLIVKSYNYKLYLDIFDDSIIMCRINPMSYNRILSGLEEHAVVYFFVFNKYHEIVRRIVRKVG